jgi:hypothetical protein
MRNVAGALDRIKVRPFCYLAKKGDPGGVDIAAASGDCKDAAREAKAREGHRGPDVCSRSVVDCVGASKT